MPSSTPALYPGSFDCLTYGHINLIERCAGIFSRVLVAVAENPNKRPLFPLEERLEMLRESTRDIPNVETDSFRGLTVDYARRRGIRVIIRGMRVVTDFESELQMALMNKRLAGDVETIFMPPAVGHEFVSSSLTKEILHNGGDVSSLVPPHVEAALRQRLDLEPGRPA